MWDNNEINGSYREIFRRKSVRRYENKNITLETLNRLTSSISKAQRLNENPVAFRILTSDQVKKTFGNATYYLAAYSRPDTDSAINASFVMQQLSLWLSTQNIGSCWLGMHKPKEETAQAEGLPFFMMMAFGHGTDDIYRHDVKGFERKPLLEITDLKEMEDLLEAGRLAPSAINQQSWYFSGDSSKVRLFIAEPPFLFKNMMRHLKAADAGIVLSHLWLSILVKNRFDGFIKESGVSFPGNKNMKYVWTINLKN
jgi:nitroreductase